MGHESKHTHGSHCAFFHQVAVMKNVPFVVPASKAFSFSKLHTATTVL